jgi:membrane associated rhomboid family serine protease
MSRWRPEGHGRGTRLLSGCGMLIVAVVFGAFSGCLIGPYVGFGLGKVPEIQPGYEGMIPGFWGAIAGFIVGLVLFFLVWRPGR